MERIEVAVERQLSRFDGRGAMPRLVAAWPAAVGAEVARNAWPARVARDGTLHVHTSSSVWAFELGQLAPRILERLRVELGTAAPAALRFAAGPLPEPAPEASASPPRPGPAPAPEAVRAGAELAASISDDELRERVARAAALSLSAHPDGRRL